MKTFNVSYTHFLTNKSPLCFSVKEIVRTRAKQNTLEKRLEIASRFRASKLTLYGFYKQHWKDCDGAKFSTFCKWARMKALDGYADELVTFAQAFRQNLALNNYVGAMSSVNFAMAEQFYREDYINRREVGAANLPALTKAVFKEIKNILCVMENC